MRFAIGFCLALWACSWVVAFYAQAHTARPATPLVLVAVFGGGSTHPVAA